MLVDEDEAILQLVQGNCSVENGQYRQGATQVEEEVNNEMVDTDTTSEKDNEQRSTCDVEGTTQSLPGPSNPLKSVRYTLTQGIYRGTTVKLVVNVVKSLELYTVPNLISSTSN